MRQACNAFVLEAGRIARQRACSTEAMPCSRELNRAFCIAMLGLAILPIGAQAQGGGGFHVYSGIQIQNISDTSGTVEISYYGASVNSNGVVTYGTDLTDRRAIKVAVPGGGSATVADTGPGSQFSALNNFSQDDLNNVAFQGTSTNPGIWQGSVIINSSNQPIVGVINQVVNQGSSTINSYNTLGSSAGSTLVAPYVHFRARDSASPTPSAFNLYKGTFGTPFYNIQNVETAAGTDITATFSVYGNSRGDFAIRGVQVLPDPPFTREAIGIVNPDDPSRDTVVTISGDNVGGSATTGFSGNVVVSADGNSIVAITNTNAGPGARAAVAYNGFSTDGGTTLFIPYVMKNTFDTGLGLIDNITVDASNGMAAWKARLDNLSEQVIEVGSTNPASNQPIIEVARTGQPLAGTGLTSPVSTLALAAEAWSGGGRNQFAFTAVLQDSTQVVAVATLTEDPAAQPSQLPGPVPVGAEQQVNTTTTGDQRAPAVSMANDGSFVVTWATTAGPASSISAQLYDASGAPQGSEIVVTTASSPSVVSDPDVGVNPGTGNFAVTWRLGDDFSANAWIRFYDAGGTPAGAPALVVGGPAATTSSPSVAASDNRYAVTASTTSGPDGFVFYRLYDASGTTLAFPFPVNVAQPMTDTNPSVTIDGADVSTVAWWSAAGQAVKRRVDASGTALGAAETPISDQTPTSDPQIDANDSGDFRTTMPITFTRVIKLFDANGDPISNDVPMNTTPADPAGESSVAMDNQGTGGGVWAGAARADIRANWVASNGVVSTGEHALTDSQPGKRGEPDITMNGSGQAAVVYRTDDQDGDAGGIYVVRIDGQRTILGGEFPGSASTAGDQNSAAVAASDAGDLVNTYVVSATNINYGRYDEDGNLISPEITANTITGTNSNPDVARNAAGLTNIVWQNNDTGIWSQYFDGSDTPIGSNFQVNQTTTGKTSKPRLVMDDDGTIYVVWDRAGSPEIVFRKFDSSASALTNEIPVNTTSDGSQAEPAIAISENLLYLPIIFKGNSIHGRLLDLDGDPITPEFQVNTIATGDQTQPEVVALPNGFVTAFTSTHQDGDVYRRYFDHNGAALDPEVRVNTFSPNLQHEPTIAADANGNHVIGWTSLNQDGSVSGVYGQWFNSDGLPQGNEFRLNSTTAGGQSQPAVAMLSGRIASIWTSAGQDGNGDGLFGRMFYRAPGDTDRDNVSDGADDCANTIPGALVGADGCPPLIPGDLDRDGDVDLTDVAQFRICAGGSGPEVPYDPGSLPPGCDQTPNASNIIPPDLDEDGDVDQSDWGLGQICFHGENIAVCIVAGECSACE